MRKGWQSVYDFISDFIIPVVVVLSVIGALGYFSWPYLSQLSESTEQRRAEQGRHYLTDCQVTEKMLPRGSGLSVKIFCNAVPPGSMSVCLSISVPPEPGMTRSRHRPPR